MKRLGSDRLSHPIKMYSIKKTSVSYVPPSKREADPLAAENFPVFGNVKAVTREKPSLNFLQKVKEVEEEQLRREHKIGKFNPWEVHEQTVEQLEYNGWAVLPLDLEAVQKAIKALAEMKPEDWIEEEDE